MSARPPLRLFKLLYFSHYGSVAVLMAAFPSYLRGLGFSGEQIGAAWAPAQVALAPAALLWGAAADKLRAASKALQLCTAGALAVMCLLPLARTPALVGALLFSHALFNAGTVPLVDSLTMEAVHGSAHATYARTRAAGSVGFVVVAQALGLALAARGNLNADRLVPLALIAMVGGTAVSATLIRLRAVKVMKISPAPAKAHLRDAMRLLRGPILILLVANAVHWAACAPYHLLFGVLVRDRGLGAELTGLSMALGVVAEILALVAFPRLTKRFSLPALFSLAFAASAIRWLLVSRASSPTELVALQLIHGLTFGLWWGASVQAMGQLVPAPLRATGQALFGAVVFGFGNAAGYALAGIGYDRFRGAERVFAVAGLVEVVLAVIAIGVAVVVARREAAASTD